MPLGSLLVATVCDMVMQWQSARSVITLHLAISNENLKHYAKSVFAFYKFLISRRVFQSRKTEIRYRTRLYKSYDICETAAGELAT
jgi:hypothetical protein